MTNVALVSQSNRQQASAAGGPVRGAGLGLRRGMMDKLLELPETAVDFLELAPENWIGVGGAFGRKFETLAQRFPLVCHGLSLSIGSPATLDYDFLRQVREFLDRYEVLAYTEHLSYCSDDKGHLYDLMPIPFTDEAVHYVAGRIREIQDVLERRIGIEHISYYAAPGQELSEIEFIQAVLDEADCDLLLDVNNIYVNSVNFSYDPDAFLRAMPSERIRYIHTAGHYVEAPDLLVDTHGSAVTQVVWELLRSAYEYHGVQGTLLERDFNFPPMADLLSEITMIRELQAAA